MDTKGSVRSVPPQDHEAPPGEGQKPALVFLGHLADYPCRREQGVHQLPEAPPPPKLPPPPWNPSAA